MEKKLIPVVLCVCTKEGKSLSEILEESFRLYLIHVLAASESEPSATPHSQ